MFLLFGLKMQLYAVLICMYDTICGFVWSCIHLRQMGWKWLFQLFSHGSCFCMCTVLYSKSYIPSTLNIDLILWHTQVIVCAVNVKSWVISFTYINPIPCHIRWIKYVVAYVNFLFEFKAVLALPKTAGSAQTHESISFI